jgi:hypothetical protein
MSKLLGTIQDGSVVLDASAEWPNGCRVVVQPLREQEVLGMGEEDWSDTPEAIAEWLHWYDSLEPLLMSPEEEAECQAARKAQKEYELLKFEERTKRIEELFQ